MSCDSFALFIDQHLDEAAEHDCDADSNVDLGLEVPRIGDVGYLEDDHFVRLLNVLRPSNHILNLAGVPERYQPLDIEDELIERRTICPANAAGVDSSVTTPSERAEPSLSHLQDPTRPASYTELLQPNAAVSSYLVQHFGAWQRFAHTLQLGRRDLFFVSGVTYPAAGAAPTRTSIARPPPASSACAPSRRLSLRRPRARDVTAPATSHTAKDVSVMRTKVLRRSSAGTAARFPWEKPDALDAVLAYIFENSTASIAIASDSTLPALLAASHSAQHGAAPGALLKALRPRVYVHPSGAGQLAHEWAARTFFRV
ncbi:hypothetical protein PsYK624_115460 [Phanerochaete sordida]|uniref:Uncharacterized protein n=1 Tax=Phanerochaete sordida TaxID=48140 RepID=A0A9P3GGU3_9APHY|nr:hypothetical protein PsYK624_115460 [Phanerochaete sordida]